jgi:nitroreductase
VVNSLSPIARVKPEATIFAPMTIEHAFVPHKALPFTEQETVDRARAFFELMDERRSVRHFSGKPVPMAVIEDLVRTASTAPSGSHKQPWTFCVVSDPELKMRIREAAEREEFENYNGRMPADWLVDLAPLGTGWEKPYLEIAPYLIVVFKQAYELTEQGKRRKNYYVDESVSIACGFLLAAIHQAGLVALTHTPSPMNFLAELLARPENERPVLLIPVGYPDDPCLVPDLKRKPLEQVMVRY